ncbi:MAG: tRNA (guanosine(46)-N7)-methyltransferase TrmB [Pseudomonadota bacterium]
MDETARSHHTYIRRRGRITSAQQRGYRLAKDRYPYRVEVLSQPGACTGLEIGFGMGHALVHWAESEPQRIIVGADLYQPGIGSLAHMLEQQNIDNVFIAEQPAQELVLQMPDAVLDEVRIYFPDPWPKKRHFKRRLIQSQFIQDLRRTMRKGGIIKLATDWAPYAIWMREHFEHAVGFELVYDHKTDESADASGSHTQERLTTKFESRGERLGHEIHDFGYRAI